jgi:hypothetical protein
MGLDIRAGVTGYRDQLDRTRRFLDRLDRPYPSVVDYQDDVFAFFQNCWHLKDWIRNDPLIPEDQKQRLKQAAEGSRTLAICNDMANGTKHLELKKARAGAAHSHIRIAAKGGGPTMDCVIDVNGTAMLARVVARGCVEEWEKLLSAEGLPIERRSWLA